MSPWVPWTPRADAKDAIERSCGGQRARVWQGNAAYRRRVPPWMRFRMSWGGGWRPAASSAGGDARAGAAAALSRAMPRCWGGDSCDRPGVCVGHTVMGGGERQESKLIKKKQRGKKDGLRCVVGDAARLPQTEHGGAMAMMGSRRGAPRPLCVPSGVRGGNDGEGRDG